VLVVPRALYETLQISYPREVCRLLASLKGRAEKLLLEKLEDVVSMQMVINSPLSVKLAPYLHKGKLGSTDLPDGILSEIKSETGLD
jgi:hypothetical protein